MTKTETHISRGPVVADTTEVLDLLRRWLAAVLAPDAKDWLFAELARQQSGVDERKLAIALGLIGRKLASSDLMLSPPEVAAAQRVRADWRPDLWSSAEAARVALLLATAQDDADAFAARVDRLCTTAELGEQIALMKGLAVFPAAAALHDRAREDLQQYLNQTGSPSDAAHIRAALLDLQRM